MRPKAELTCAKSMVSCEACNLKESCIIYKVAQTFAVGFSAIKRLTNLEETKAPA